MFQEERYRMVSEQIEQRGIDDPRLLEVMRRVPRHLFVPEEMIVAAYEDDPLPIGDGQTISQPFIVAYMTNLFHFKGSEKVLEIGTGSGYQAMILAGMVNTVHTVERHSLLAESAAARIKQLGANNVWVHCGDGSGGWPQFAPYDAILMTAAAPQIPEQVLAQLCDGGQLVAPVGSMGRQVLQHWSRKGNEFQYKDLLPVTFVPLRGECGWSTLDW